MMPPNGLGLWNRLEVTDPAFAKAFDKGNFKGTAVDAVYNIKRVTELLGPVGFAWGWHVVRDELVRFGEGDAEQHIHSCVLRAWFRQEDGSVREVEHVGQTIAARWVGRGTARRFMVDDEYAKKSVTDALSKVMMSLGASADIWLGRFDGNKYVPPRAEDRRPEEHEPPVRRTPLKAPAAAGAELRTADRDPFKIAGLPAKEALRVLEVGLEAAPTAEGAVELWECYRERVRRMPGQAFAVLDALVAARVAEARDPDPEPPSEGPDMARVAVLGPNDTIFVQWPGEANASPAMVVVAKNEFRRRAEVKSAAWRERCLTDNPVLAELLRRDEQEGLADA